MSYDKIADTIAQEPGVEKSTMMGSPCLRYHGEFMAMMFDREESLIIKVSPDRVSELINDDTGREFNFTKKRFKEWVLISLDHEKDYESYIREALSYAQSKS